MKFSVNSEDPLDTALVLAAEGLHCFPCSSNKRPTCPNGFLDATTDPKELDALWTNPGPLVGVRSGANSNIDVLDIDVGHPEALAWWTSNRAQIPTTRVHRTRRRGLHLLFRHHPGLRCSIGRLAKGVDVRAEGGYFVWWPAAGCAVLNDGPVAQWPAWLLALLQPPAQAKNRCLVVPDERALAGLVRLVANAREGERNQVLFWAACRLGEMVATRLLNSQLAIALIADAAVHAGLPRFEAERTARSGLCAGGGGHAR